MFIEVPLFSETSPTLKNSWLSACYPDIVLYDGKRFCSILTDLSNLSFLFYENLKSEECSYKTVSKNSEVAVRKCSLK